MGVSIALAAPYYRQERSLLPIDSTENIGTSTTRWAEGWFSDINVSGTCTGCTTLSGGSANTLTYWTSSSALGATSSPMVGFIFATTSTASTFTGGFLSLASSTLQAFTATNATTSAATTTGLAISGITSSLLKTSSSGSVIPAISDTDYEPAGSYVTQATTITIAGTANQITSSAGAQDLSANRTWTLSLPSLVVFPSNASSTQFTTTGATYLATAGGNVGIGTASPSAPLDIVTATDRSIKFYSELEKMHMYVTHPYDAFEINLRTSSAFYFSGGAIRISGTDGIFSTSDYGYFSFSPAGIKALRAYSPAPAVNYLQVQGSATGVAPLFSTQGTDTDINLAIMPKGAGNVGIGTTSPAYKLDIYGGLRIDQATGELIIPASSSQTPATIGEIAIDTTSGQLKWYDGNKLQVITGTTTKAFNIASTTLDASGKSFNTATSTFLLANFPEAMTLQGFYCTASTTGTALVRFGDGTNWTETGSCSSGGFTTTASNNTFTAYEAFNFQASSTAGAVSRITVTAVFNKTAD